MRARHEATAHEAARVVADLEAQIAAVKQRAAQKEAAAEVKGSADGVAFLAAVKAADRAIRVAGEHRNDGMVRALEAARAPLVEHLVSMGIRLPDAKARRLRKAEGRGSRVVTEPSPGGVIRAKFRPARAVLAAAATPSPPPTPRRARSEQLARQLALAHWIDRAVEEGRVSSRPRAPRPAVRTCCSTT